MKRTKITFCGKLIHIDVKGIFIRDFPFSSTLTHKNFNKYILAFLLIRPAFLECACVFVHSDNSTGHQIFVEQGKKNQKASINVPLNCQRSDQTLFGARHVT